MSNDVVKQMQLAKQLEQKAKEASRKKETAESLAKEAQEALAKADSEGIQLPNEKALLKQVEKAIANKDYNAAIATAVQITQDCEKARRARFEEDMASLEEALRLIKDAEKRKNLELGLDKARELAAEELDAAISTMNEVVVSIEDAAAEYARSIAEKVRGLLILSTRLGLDLREQEKAFNEIRAAMELGRSRDILTAARAILEETEDALRGEFGRRAEALRPLTVSNQVVAGGLRTAERKLDAGDLEGAFSSLLSLDGEVRRGTIDEKKRELEKLERRIEFAAKMGGDTSAMEAKAREAGRRLREDDLDGVAQSLADLQGGMKDLETQIFTDVMVTLRPRLAVATKVRIDISAGERRVEQARAAMTEGDFPKAMTELKEAEDMIIRSIQGHEQLEQALAHSLLLLKLATDLKADVTKAKQLMTQARQVALIRDFKRATGLLQSADGELSRRIEESIGRDVLSMEMDIMLAQKMGVDTEDEAALLETATQMVQKGDYEEGVTALQRAGPSLRRKVRDACANYLAEFTKSVEEHRGPGDKAPARRTLEEAKAQFEAENYSACYDLGLQAVMKLRAQEREVLRVRAAEAAEMLKLVQDMDMDEPALIEQGERLRRLEVSNNSAEAMELAEHLYREATMLVSEEVERRLMATERQLSALKRKGLASATDLAAVDTAAALLANGQLREALVALQEAERKSENVAREQSDIYDVIVEMSILLEEAVARDMQVEAQVAMLEKTRTLYESGRLGEARLSAAMAMRETRAAVCEFVAPEALRSAWDLLLLARKIGMPVEALEQRYYEAEDALNQQRYDTSLERSESIREEVTGRLRSALNERLRPVESYLSQGRSLRYAEQALFPLLEKARVLVMERRYGEAAELASHLASEVEALRQRERAAERAVEELRELTLNFDELGLDAREAREILDMAARQAQQGDPGAAAMLAQRGAQAALRTAADEMQSRAERLLAEHHLEKLDGEDLQTAALRLEEMLALSQRGMLEEALQRLRAVEASLKEYERLKELALRDLVEVEQMARTAAQKGVLLDGLQESLTDARLRIEGGSPSAAHTLLAAKRGELAWSMQIISSRKEGLAKLRSEADTLSDASRRQEVLLVLSRAESKLNEMELIDNDLGMRRAAAMIKEARDQEAGRQKMRAAIAAEMLAEAGVRMPEAKGEALWEARLAALAPLLQRSRAAAEAAVAQSPTGPGAALLRKAGDMVAAGEVIDAIETFRAAATAAAFSTVDATEYLELRRHALELLNMSFTGAARKERRALAEIESGKAQAAEAMDAIRRLNKEMEKALASTGADLEMDIDADDAIAGGGQKVLFRLTNDGPVPVHGLEMKAEAEADILLPELPQRLEPYSSVRLEIEVEPRGSGELQLRLQLSYMIPTTRRRHRLERTAVLTVSS